MSAVQSLTLMALKGYCPNLVNVTDYQVDVNGNITWTGGTADPRASKVASQVAQQQSSLSIAPPASATQPVWVRASWGGSEQLSVQASYDLQDWVILSNYTAPSFSVRDPQLLYHRGRWWAVYTESSNANGTGTTFGLAVSDDLINFTFVANVDLSTHLSNGAQLIWQPLLFEDINGNAQCLVTCLGDGKIAYLTPTDQNDISTLSFVSFLTTPWSNISQSISLVGSTYYVCTSDGANHYLYSASIFTGPWSLVTQLTTVVSGDSAQLFVDRDNTWYMSINGSTGSRDDNGYAIQVSPGGYTAFNTSMFVGTPRRFVNSPSSWSINPSIRRHYGAAALSARAAIQQAIAQKIPFPVGNIGSDISFISANGGAANYDSGYGFSRPFVGSGTTVSGQATATLLGTIAWGQIANNLPLVSVNQPYEINLQILHYIGTTAKARVLFGVPKDHLGTLNNAGYGLEFGYTNPNETVSLLIHDGTTLHSYTSPIIPPNGFTSIRVRVMLSYITVWINGVEFFRRNDLPNGSVASHDLNYVSVETDYGGTGGASDIWVSHGSYHLYHE